jgi:RimJ/RimL family protein N-acetyltransferase
VAQRRAQHARERAGIASNQENWRSNGPRRALGVFECASNRLIGSVEVNLSRLLGPGEVNVSYGIFLHWRGQGLAIRAVNLMGEYLRAATDAIKIVLGISPANAASIRVAEKAGFTLLGVFAEPEGSMTRYIRDVKP